MNEHGQEIHSIAKLQASQIKALVDWQSEAEFFVPLRASVRAFMPEDFPLEDDIEAFLISDKKVMLLLGDSGSGKSLYTQGLVAKKWQCYSSQKCIPLWISLPSLKNPIERAIEETLEKAGLVSVEIEQLRQENQFLFIFDGYDEIRQIKNLYVSNHLENWQAKVIVTCRREYLYHVDNHALHFTPFLKERAVHAAYMERVIKPFNAEQIDRYIQQSVARGGTAWPDWQRYRAGIDEIPGLSDLLSSPFMLKLAMSVLPTLLERYQGKGDLRIQITQAAIYDAFIEQWFERQQAKLKGSGEIPEEEDLKPAFWNYAKALAQAMHEAKITVVNYETESSLFDEEINSWAKFFAPEDQRVALLQTACLVREISPKHYAFVHGSLLSYFMSRHLYESLLITGLAENEASKFTEENSNQEAAPVKSTPQKLADEQSYFNQCLLVRDSETIQFSADKICEGAEGAALKKRYFSLVEASKNNPSMSIAAANSITILNRARINFSGMDLSRLQIPFANLEGGLFHHTNFGGSNLRAVNFSKAYLVNAQLQEADLTDVEFGERPYLSVSDMVNAIGYSPDGKLLAIAAANNIEIWDATEESLRLKCVGHTDVVTSIAFTSDDQYLVSGSKDKTLRLWSVETGELITTLEGHESEVTSVACHPEGKRLVSASKDGTVRQWSNDTYKVININKRHSGKVTCVAYSPNGKYLASGGEDKIVRQWSVETGKLYSVSTQHTDKITSLAYSPDNRFLASGSENELCTWLVQSGELIHKESVLDGITCLIFNPDSQFLASGSGTGTVRQWSTTTGALRTVHKGLFLSVTGIAYHPSGQRLLASSVNYVRQWSTVQSQSTPVTNISGGHLGFVHNLTCDNNAQKLLCSTAQGVHQWSMDDGSLLSRIVGTAAAGIAFSPDGQRLAVGNSDGSICQWLLEGVSTLLSESKGHTEMICSVAYSHVGDRFASASSDGTVWQWSTETGKYLTRSPAYTTKMLSVAYSLDDAYLVARSEDGTIHHFDVRTSEVLYRFVAKFEGFSKIANSPNGAYFAFALNEYTLCQWSVKTRAIISEHYILAPMCVAYSCDGQYLVAGGGLGKVYIWNASDHHDPVEVKILHSGADSISCIALTIQNDIVVGTSGGEIKYWRYDSTQKTPTWELKWSTHRQSPELLATDCNIANAIGLSKRNRLLLSRFGIYETGKDEDDGSLFHEILHEVVNQDNKGAVRDLLSCGANINYMCSGGYTPINLAIGNRNYLMAKELLTWKPDLTIKDPESYTSLGRAIMNGDGKIVDDLLVAGAKINEEHSDGFSALHIASKFGHEEIIELLLAHGADINGITPAGWTPLHFAADEGHENAIKRLLANGADITLINESDETPGEVAARKGHQLIVVLLQLSVKRAPKPSLLSTLKNRLQQKSSNQDSSLIDVAKVGNLAVVQSLLQGGAKVNAQDEEGYTALHWCANRGYRTLAELLLAHGAKVKIKNNDGRTALHVAAGGGYKMLVELLLDKRAKINAKANNGATPLHYAAGNGDRKGLEVLLSRGAKKYAEDNDGWRPLHYAAQGGQIEAIEILLAQGAEIEAKTKDGSTALHCAGSNKKRQAIELLLSRGADMYAKDNNGWSLFQHAINAGYKDIVEKFLDQGAADVYTKANDGMMPLHIAARVGHRDIVEMFLKKGAEINVIDAQYGKTALHYAAQYGQIEIIEVLLANGAEINAKSNDGSTALDEAAWNDHSEAIRVLLSHGGNINAQSNSGETPLHWAARKGLKVTVELLLVHEADIEAKDNEGSTPLHAAASEGHGEVIEVLLSHGAEINAKDNNGSTALHVAVFYDHKELVEVLLMHNASVITQDKNGWTPLHWAVENGLNETVELLFAYKAEVNCRTGEGEHGCQTPLHRAAASGYEEIVRVLLSNGADIEARDSEGCAPINQAVWYDQKKIVEIFIMHNASMTTQDKNGWTPLHWASRKGNKEIIALLLEHGADITAKDHEGSTMLHHAALGDQVEFAKTLLVCGDLESLNHHGRKPLHVAAREGHEKMVRFLLGSKADFNPRDTEFGNTPLHFAAQNGHVEVVKILLEQGADPEIKNIAGMTALQLAAQAEHGSIVTILNALLPSIPAQPITQLEANKVTGRQPRKPKMLARDVPGEVIKQPLAKMGFFTSPPKPSLLSKLKNRLKPEREETAKAPEEDGTSDTTKFSANN